MNKIKIFIASGIFIVITIIKLAVPTAAQEIKSRLIPGIEKDTDYREAMSQVGEIITADGGVISVLGSLYESVIPVSTTSLSSFSDMKMVDKNLEIASLNDAKENMLNKDLKDESAQITNKPYTAVIPINAVSQVSETLGKSDKIDPTQEPKMLQEQDILEEGGAKATDNVEASNGYQEKVSETNTSSEASEDVSVQDVQATDNTLDQTVEMPPQEATAAEPEVVETFLKQQAEFEGHDIPVNVNTHRPELTFEYTAPVAGMNSSGFGFRIHPIDEEVKFHFGTDFAAYTGTEILAFAEGTVIAADEIDSYGKYVMLSHEDGFTTLYAHCSELLVERGEYVNMGDVIALVGGTGQVTGPHLHFELLYDGYYLNPEYYLG